MNIPECEGENCQDIIYDIMENDLKINKDEIRFHAVHRIGKPPGNGTTPTLPRPIIARFVVREDSEAVFSVKNRLKSPIKYKEGYITKLLLLRLCTSQKERKTLIQAMFAAKQAGRIAKVINRKLLLMITNTTSLAFQLSFGQLLSDALPDSRHPITINNSAKQSLISWLCLSSLSKFKYCNLLCLFSLCLVC